MTAYEKICADRCEWCAKKYPRVDRVWIHVLGNGCLPLRKLGQKPRPCTAPTKDSFIEELSAELAEARNDTATFAEIEALGLYRRCDSRRRNAEDIKQLIYAARAAQPEGEKE